MKLKMVEGSNFSSNCYIIYDNDVKEILVIDLGLRGRLSRFPLKKTLSEITNKEFKDYKVQVFLSHCHVDHILGEDNLTDFSDILFSSSSLTAEHINSRDNVTLMQKYPVKKIQYSVEKVYENNDRLTIGSDELKVITAPGHTDGSAVLFHEETKSLFSGDVVFDSSCGRMDLPTGSQSQMVQSISNLTKYDIEHLYSGHGLSLHKNVNQNIKSTLRMLEFY